MRQASQRCAVTLLTAGLITMLTFGSCARDTAPAKDLADRLARTEEPYTFAFSYAASGTRTRDCFRSNTVFSGVVDQDEGLAVIAAVDGQPVAEVRRSASAISGRLVGLDAAVWVTFRSPVEVGAYRDALRRALGSDLGPYVLAGDIPPSGRATVSAALEEGATVKGPDREDVDGNPAWRYDLLLPPDVAGVDFSGADLSAWLDEDGAVIRLAISTSAEAADVDHESGWQLDYSYADVGSIASPVASSRSLLEFDPAELRSPSLDCRLPL